MESYQKNQLDIGVADVKLDECDGYDHWLWPEVATFPSGLEAEQIRQTYDLILVSDCEMLHTQMKLAWCLTIVCTCFRDLKRSKQFCGCN